MPTRTIWMLALSIALGGCSGLTVTASDAAICEALRPSMPILYRGSLDTPDTIARIRSANARFAAACS